MAIYAISKYGDGGVTGANTYGLEAPPAYLVDPFVAASVDYGRILITWKKPSGAILRYRLLKNRYGFPVNETDGDILLDSVTYPGSQYVDQNIIQGTYHYYGFYVQVDIADNIWIRGGVTACLSNAEFGSAKMMWDHIPEHFRTQLDGAELTTDAAGNIYLQQFLTVLGWGMDYLRTQYWAAASFLNNPMAMPVNDLWNMASEVGLEFSPEVPAYTMRKAVANMATVSRERGTLSGLRNEIVLRTSWDADVTIGPNIILNDDQSQFLNNISLYEPNRFYMTREIVVVYADRDSGRRWEWGENDRRSWLYNGRYGPANHIGYTYYSLVDNNRYPFPGQYGTTHWGDNDAHWHCCRDDDDVYYRMVNTVTSVPATWEVVDSSVTGGVPAAGSGTLGTGVTHPLNTNDATATSFRMKNLGGSAKTMWGRSVARRNTDLYNIVDYNFEQGVAMPGRHHQNQYWVPDDWPQVFWEPDESWSWWPSDWWRGPYHHAAYWTPVNCRIEQSRDCSRSGLHSAKITPQGFVQPPFIAGNTATQAQAQLADPGFETSVVGWTAGSAPVAQDTLPHSGTHSLSVNSYSAFTLTGPKVAIQTGSVSPSTITVSFWVRDYASTTTCTPGLQFYTAAGVAIGSPSMGTAASVTTSYSNPSFTVTAPSNAALAALVVTCPGPASSYLYIDDVLFSAVLAGSAPPVTATLTNCGAISPWAKCPGATSVTGTVYVRPKSTTLSTTLTASLVWYDRWGTKISISSGTPVTPAASSTFSTTMTTGAQTSPANTRYVALELSYTAAQVTDIIYVADVDFNVNVTLPANYAVQTTEAIQDGLPVPWVRASQQWNPAIRYGTNDMVLYQDQPFIALRASTGAPPPTNNIASPEWAPLSENQRIRLAVSAYTSQNMTAAPLTAAVGVIPFVEWFDKHGNWIARVFARQPGLSGVVGKPDQLTFDSFTSLSVVSGSGGSGSVTLGPWRANYYSNTTLSGAPALTRTDASIGLWASGASPGTGLPTSGWSASWSNSFTPSVTGTYTFAISQTGGGCRVIVNGATVVDNWTGSGSTSGTAALTAGSPISITVQYYDNAVVSSPGGWSANLLSGFSDSESGINRSGTRYDSSSPVSIVSGQPYKFSANVSSNSYSYSSVSATITWYDASGTPVSTTVSGNWTTPYNSGGHTENGSVSAQGNAPASAVYAIVTFALYDSESNQNDTMSFSNVNFQQNLAATGTSALTLTAPSYAGTGATITSSTLTGRATDDHQSNWATPVGNFSVGQFAHGSAWPSVPGTRSLALLTGQANTNVAVTFRSGAGSMTQGLVFRYANDNNYWRADRKYLKKKVGTGTSATWATVATFTTPFADNDRMMVTLNGSVINIYRNAPGGVPANPAGYQVMPTVTDSFNATAAQYGIVVE